MGTEMFVPLVTVADPDTALLLWAACVERAASAAVLQSTAHASRNPDAAMLWQSARESYDALAGTLWEEYERTRDDAGEDTVGQGIVTSPLPVLPRIGPRRD